LSGSFLKIGRIKGLSRPCIAPTFITAKGGKVIAIDGGANMDATVQNLIHFAIMGNAYMTCGYGIENPKIALLNVGPEEGKGNELTKAAFYELKKLPINFAGNMEARDFLSGKYDVVVTDGFGGNVLIKATEGALKFSLSEVKKGIMSTFLGKMGGLMLKPTFARLMKKLDYKYYTGSPILGVNKLVIKTHGSSNEFTFYESAAHIIMMHKNGLIEKVRAGIAKTVNIE